MIGPHPPPLSPLDPTDQASTLSGRPWRRSGITSPPLALPRNPRGSVLLPFSPPLLFSFRVVRDLRRSKTAPALSQSLKQGRGGFFLATGCGMSNKRRGTRYLRIASPSVVMGAACYNSSWLGMIPGRHPIAQVQRKVCPEISFCLFLSCVGPYSAMQGEKGNKRTCVEKCNSASPMIDIEAHP